MMNTELETPPAVDPNALHYQEILFSLVMGVVDVLGRGNPLVRCPDILNVALSSFVPGLSGGERSNFWPLYLLPIFTACLHLERRHVLGACVAAGAYLACFYLEALWEVRGTIGLMGKP